MLRPGAARTSHLHAIVRGTVVVVAAAVAGHAGLAQQSVRLVPSISRFAGDGTSNPTSNAGKANTIPLSAPAYVTADGSGIVYIADTGNNCIRRVDLSGNMTVAVGQPTSASDTCRNASSVTGSYLTGVLQPSGLAFTPSGDLFIADTGHNCVRLLTHGSSGIAALGAAVGNCTTPSSTSIAPSPAGLAVDAAGNLYIAINDSTDGIFQVIRSSPSSGYTTACLVSGAPSAAVGTPCPGITGGVVLNAPQGLAIDPIGNLFIADSGNACVREISGVTASTAVGKCTNDGTGSISTALQKPVSVITDAVGHLYVTDNSAGEIFEGLNGKLVPVGGNGLTGTYTTNQEGDAAISVSLLNPQGLGADKSGNLYLADTNNNVIRILSQGLRFAGIGVGNHSSPPQTLWFVITAAVNLTSGPAGNDFHVFQGQNGCTGAIAAPTPGQVKTCKISLQFTPTVPGLRTAPLTLTDSAVSPAAVYRFGLSGLGQGGEAIFNPGTIKTLAASLASPSAIAIDNAGNVYYAEAGTGSGNGSISILAAGSTTPTTLIAPGGGAASPQALALDPAGNLFIADAATNSILRYDSSGTVTTAVSGLTSPAALVVDPLDNIYVAENGATPGILKIYAGGQQTFIAGQGTQPLPNNVPATTAKFVQLSALYMDPSGNIYVADSGALFVYQIDTSGIIHPFAGNGTTTDSASGSPLGTGLPGIAGLGADPAGDIYIADSVSNRLLVVLSGVPQSASVSVLAGTGTAGYTGDNGPANLATLNSPAAVAIDSAGEVFLADSGNNALREITYPQPTLNFGTVKVGTTGGPLNTSVWNVGNAGLTPLPGVLADTTNFGFDTVGSNCPTNLSAGDTCVASFVCTPQAPGSFTTQYNQTAGPQGTTQANLLCTAPPPPQTNLVAPAVTVVYGNAYTLAATITGNQTSAPTGMAVISINGVAVCPSAPLPANGAVSCTPSPTFKDVGTYTVTVSYSGDTNYPASTSTFILTVTPRPVTVTAANQTRPVNTPNPTLTGTVANVVAGQSITAAFSTTATTASPAGAYPITAAYAFGAGTNPADYTVIVVNGTLTITTSGTGGGGGGGGGGSTGGSFTLTAAPPEQEIDHQGTVNYPVSLVSTGGFSGTVALSCSGLPEGAGCSFSTPNVTLASGATVASTMTITATADGTNVPTVFSSTRPGPRPGPRLGPMEPYGGISPLLAWTMLPLGLGGSAGTLLFGRAARRRQLFLLVPFALLLALGVSGCASPSNYKIYTVTVTGSGVSAGATIKQSATVDLVLAR